MCVVPEEVEEHVE